MTCHKMAWKKGNEGGQNGKKIYGKAGGKTS